MKKNIFAIGLSLLIISQATAQKKSAPKDTRPNIVLIMADDLGYSDLGAYGSEINTPHLDRLAKEGTMLKEFYNNSICAPTRASLITGQYSHKAGVGYFDVNLGLPAYQGFLNKESLTFAEVLREAGYSTLTSGKWHVGEDSLYWPNQRGFDKSYGIIKGASSYFDAESFPLGQTMYPVTLQRNNQRLNPEKDSYYFTDEVVNNAISFLDEQNTTGKPFFLYLAFTAPHWPLHALPEDIAKYKGKYDLGWDSLRTLRIEKQKKLKIFDQDNTLAERDPEVPRWDLLTYDEKQFWKTKAEIYAAMVDRLDQNVGRLLEKLKQLKKDDNTLIIFLSDNGSDASLRGNNPLSRKFVRNAGPIGTSGSFDYHERNWAYLFNTPFRNYKGTFYEGGFRTPFIAWYPKQIPAGTVKKGTGHIIDIAPTLYEFAGAKYPEQYNGATANPLPGKSLVNVLTGTDETVNRTEPLFWERGGNRAVRKGKWKLVSTYPSYQWELYDIEADKGETNNLAARYPNVVNELSSDYFKWAPKNDVVDYDKIKPATGGAGAPPRPAAR